ncbi:MAG: CHAT domain-containing protein [Pseudonocardiaceae bacterium]
MTTLDFELEIGSGNGHTYPVVARAPGGEATTTMHLLLTSAQLDEHLVMVRNKVLTSSALLRGAPTADERPVRELGQRLFEALVADDVRSLYVTSRQRAREQGSVLRLVLRVRPPELARLPWEFLFDPGQQDYLGLSMPLVRYPEVLAPRQPLQVALPLRVLGMVARPGDQHVLDVEEEQRRLRTALADLEREGLVELSWVEGQTYTALEDTLDQGPWHVFHFVGHGGYNRDAEEGTLALADETGRTRWVGADDLSRLFAEHHTLRLVVLNACDTGRSGALDAFSSTAGALVRRWVPAVLAMQFEISDLAAVRFAQTFYESVAKRRPVDDSVMRARRALRLDNSHTLEWGTPVLYLRAPEGRIFGGTDPPLPVPFPPACPIGERETEALYDQALAAYWTEQWDQAVLLLQQLLAHCPQRYPGITAKLEQARQQLQLATRYAQGCAAAQTRDWDEAIKMFTMIVEVDTGYRDAGQRLDDARRRQLSAGLQAEARRLYQAEQWAAVVKIGEQLCLLDPADADPDGLVSSAGAQLASAERAAQEASEYRRGLRLLDAGEWQQAIEALEGLDHSYRDVAALLARARRELPTLTTSPLHPPTIALYPRQVQKLWHRKAVNAVTFSPCGQRLATVGADKNARIWDASSGQECLSVTHKGVRSNARGRLANVSGRTVAFSPDGRWLATASDDETARIWCTVSERQIAAFAHDNVVVGVAFSRDGCWLATAGEDYTARVWDVGSGRRVAEFAHDYVVIEVAFSPNGGFLATASGDGTAGIWDLGSGRKTVTLNHDNQVYGVAFSPDGYRLATAGGDHTARIWDVASGRQVTTCAHDNAVLGVAFSPDGYWLATACGDGTARMWSAGSGRQLATLAHDNQVCGVAFSPDGSRLATASRDKTARIWSLNHLTGTI